MPIQKLTRADFDAPAGRNVPVEYVEFIRGLRPGDGGRAVLVEEGVASKVTMKARIEAAATAAGKPIRFLRSPAGEVHFEVPTPE